MLALLTFPVSAQEIAPSEAPTSNYWQIQAFVRPDYSNTQTTVSMKLPLSDARQNIISQSLYAPEYNFTESLDGPNRVGLWTSREEHNKPNWIILSLTAHTKLSLRPEQILESKKPAPGPVEPKPDASAQVAIDERLEQLALKGKPLREQVRVIFDYVASGIDFDPNAKTKTLPEILSNRKATVNGKALLLSALLGAINVPARRVSGLLLEDHSTKKGLYTWVQAWLGDEWLNFDPHKGLYGSLPENYLALGFGEGKWLTVSEGIGYDYQFVISKTSEEAALDTDDLVIPQDNLLDKDNFKKADLTEKESYVEKAFGRVVFITDQRIDDAVTDKIAKQASAAKIKVSFYSAPYESLFFRGNYIAKIISQKLSILKKSDAIFILSQDDAGLYALFQIAQNRQSFKNTSIFLSGAFSAPVAKIFGHSLYRLVKPKEFFIIPAKIEPERAWDILKDSLVDGLSAEDVSKRWGVPVKDLSQITVENLTKWRRFVIDTLVLASRSEVNLQSIYLVLILPIIALVIVIFRNIIGIETFGTFTPVIVAVAFLTTGAIWGSILFFIIIAVGIFFRYLFSHIHIHIVARMALLIAVVCLTMLATMILGVYIGWGALINISILPMVIMAGIVENFTQTQMEVGFKEAFRLTLATLILALISYLIIDSVGLHTLILIYPEWILGVLALEVLIGLWSGVRLIEYFRFYRIIGPQTVTRGHQDPTKDA